MLELLFELEAEVGPPQTLGATPMGERRLVPILGGQFKGRLNGKVLPSSGDIIDAASKKVIGGLRDETGREVQSEKLVEVLFVDGKPVRTVDQFGIGQVLSATN